MRTRLFWLTLGLLLPAPAYAAEVDGFGVTPTVGAVGDGRLTAQVSLEGTLICMRWPNASFYEHVKYKTDFWRTDPATNGFLKPHFGAGDNDGMFAGVRYATGATTVTHWLREATASFAYGGDRSNRLVARYAFDNGLVVEEQTFNVPEQPFLVRSYTIKTAPPGAADFFIIAYANPALRNEHGKYAPNGDYEQDDEKRWATFALADRGIIVTALPRTLPGYDAVRALDPADTSAVAAFFDAHAGEWSEGVYFAQGASVRPAGFQVGTDASLAAAGPQDAYADAGDGYLSNRAVVTEYETTALLVPAAVGTPVAWYAAFATTAAGSLAALDAARGKSPAAWADESDAWWSAKLKGVRLPADAKARRFSLRALISILTGMDPDSGAIVASTSCQPPYNVDWPRDGAFFQFALELAGLEEEAAKHARFYPKIQYTAPGTGLLSSLHGVDLVGRFPMNAFADGIPGGPIDFEIDNTGFALWSYRVHAGFLSQTDPAAARAYLHEVESSIILAADLLERCKDEATGLQCYANEDDHPEFTQTLHGAITTWLGLKSAAEMLTALGKSADAAKYRARMRQIEAAIRTHYDPSTGADLDAGQLAWSYWPAGFWTAADGETNGFASSGMVEKVRKQLLDEATRGTQYMQKATIALQLQPLRDATTVPFAAEANAKWLNALARQDTLHLAEFTNYYDLDGDGAKEWINQIATPHIWAQTLVYLSLMAAENPELFDVPAIKAASTQNADGAGCSCATRRWPEAGGALPFVILLGAALRRRLRRSLAR